MKVFEVNYPSGFSRWWHLKNYIEQMIGAKRIVSWSFYLERVKEWERAFTAQFIGLPIVDEQGQPTGKHYGQV